MADSLDGRHGTSDEYHDPFCEVCSDTKRRNFKLINPIISAWQTVKMEDTGPVTSIMIFSVRFVLTPGGETLNLLILSFQHGRQSRWKTRDQ